jgi:bifunctional DNA-binding transcriptional regulator/antitoxin component of YhaV-PrlF toxin-antitoxin module|tara:strand:+ start:682 stop:852 length:171 start_codon:yes stop_codon:yes gene_type:complete
MKQVSSVKRISQYKTIYIPDSILEDMKLDEGDNIVWFHDEESGQYFIKKVEVQVLD